VNTPLDRALAAGVLALVAGWGAGCGPAASAGDGAKDVGRAAAALTTHHASEADGAIVLRDRTGAPIPVGSTTPYSPDQTCGGCHDTSVITQGYHFQQGKGLSNTSIYVSDAYNPSKPWLLSDGMYGKW
jgi:hypothetical protein